MNTGRLWINLVLITVLCAVAELFAMTRIHHGTPRLNAALVSHGLANDIDADRMVYRSNGARVQPEVIAWLNDQGTTLTRLADTPKDKTSGK